MIFFAFTTTATTAAVGLFMEGVACTVGIYSICKGAGKRKRA